MEAPKKDVATLIRERIAANKNNKSPLPDNDIIKVVASTKIITNSKKPCATIGPGHDQKDSAETVVSSSSEKEPENDPRAALMAMLNKRVSTTIESIPSARSAPIQSDGNEGDNKKSVAKNALSAMFAERAKRENGEIQKSRDGSKNALISSILANRAPPQASSDYHASHASLSVDRTCDDRVSNDERPALKNDPK
jgi:hypothetical protein